MAFGVYEILVPLTIDAIPLLADADVIVNVSPSTSVSLASAKILTVVSSFNVWLSATATGSSLTAVIVTLTLEDAVPLLPSSIL